MAKRIPCQHRVVDLSYMAFHSDAEQRKARGEKQGRCPLCLKWVWRSHFFTHTDFLEAADCADRVLGSTEAEKRRMKRRR